MTDPRDRMIEVELLTYEEDTDVDAYCERIEMCQDELRGVDMLFGTVTVMKS